MRIKYLVPVFFALGLIAPEAKADHHGQLAYVLPVEVTVIGLTSGIRPEIVYTPFENLKWFETKASVGLMPGAEFLSTPVSLGVRGRYFDFVLHPTAGLALTEDLLWITDAAPVVRTTMEMDLGLSYDVNDRWAIDAQAYTGWGIVGEAGPVAGMRLGLRFRPQGW